MKNTNLNAGKLLEHKRSLIAGSFGLLLMYGLFKVQSTKEEIEMEILYEISEIQERSSQAIWRLMEERGIPGCSLSVWVDGQREFDAFYGMSDVENQVPVNVNTTMRIGSLADVMLMYALGRVVEDDSLNLDRPKTVEYFNDVGPLAEGVDSIRNVLERNLLNPNFRENTISYVLKEAGIDLTRYLEKEIFPEFNMQCTYPDDPEKIIPNRSRLYERKDATLVNTRSRPQRKGDYVSNSLDLCRFGHGISQVHPLSDDIMNRLGKLNTFSGKNHCDLGGSSSLVVGKNSRVMVSIICNLDNVDLVTTATQIASTFSDITEINLEREKTLWSRIVDRWWQKRKLKHLEKASIDTF